MKSSEGREGRRKTPWIPVCSLLLICSFTLDMSLNFSWPQFFQLEPKALACSVLKETRNGHVRWNKSFFSVLAPRGSIFTMLLSSSPLNVSSTFVYEMYATETGKKKTSPTPTFPNGPGKEAGGLVHGCIHKRNDSRAGGGGGGWSRF